MPSSHAKRKRSRITEADFPDSTHHASRMRTLALTGQGGTATAAALSGLIDGIGAVDPGAVRAPCGMDRPEEPRIDEVNGLIKDHDVRAALHDWWVEPDAKGRTPAWNIAAACTIGSRPGVLLVETMAHVGELNSDHMPTREKPHLARIRGALAEASDGWNAALLDYADQRGFKLSHKVKLSTDSHYRLSTRFAFAWKLADLGVPVALVYLGFLNAMEIEDDGRLLFRNHAMWGRCVFEKTNKPLPEEIWNETFDVRGTPLTVLQRSAQIAPLEKAPLNQRAHPGGG